MTAVQIIFPGRPLGDTNALDTITELRAVDSTDVNENTNIIVASNGIYKWNPSSSATDDGFVIVRPDDKTSLQAGRWIRVLGGSEDLEFKADATGATDVSADLSAAFASALAQGRDLRIPGGFYRLDNPLEVRIDDYLSYVSTFGAGPRIYGDGQGVTIFDNRCNGPLFDFDTAADHTSEFKAILGLVLEGFTVRRTQTTTGGSAIRLRSTFMAVLRDIHVIAQSNNGIEIICVDGDLDGSNMVSLQQVRIDNCPGWGIDAKAETGHNEISFLSLQDVFVQGCGTTAVGTPTSGGMRWKGQMCRITGGALAVNRNVGLYVPGESGLPNCLDVIGTAFENNYGRHVLLTGCDSARFRSGHCYSGAAYPITEGIHADSSVLPNRSVRVEGWIARAESTSNAVTLFKETKAAGTVATEFVVDGEIFQSYDHAGQTRYSDSVIVASSTPFSEQNVLTVINATTVRLRPNPYLGTGRMTLYRRRTGTGGNSTSGKVVALDLDTTGLTLTNSGLAASTTYYVYLQDVSGVATLVATTTAPVQDTATGLQVETGDVTKLYKGRVRTDGSSQFVTTGSSYLNPLQIPGDQPGTSAWAWFSSSSRRLWIRNSTIMPSSAEDGSFGYYPAAEYSTTWDPASIANGAQATTSLASGVTAAVGDYAQAAASIALSALALRAEVTASNTINWYLSNATGGAVDLASMTVRALVTRR